MKFFIFMTLSLRLLKCPAFVLSCTLAICDPVPLHAQSADSGAISASQAKSSPHPGIAVGVPQAAHFDERHKPITAGGFVKNGEIVFHDIAANANLTSWHHTGGTKAKHFLLEAKGPGVCLLDFDHDGWLDIYLVNGSTFNALTGKEASPHAALFRNNHDGTFTNVAQKAGVANDRWGYGCAVGDFDNDGWPDLYVTNFGENRLYHNNHDGTFTDVAGQAGVAIGAWSAGATFGDYDGDGYLDLFVDGYVKFDATNPSISVSQAMHGSACQFRGVNVMCGPRGLEGEQDHLFHNNGNGTFTDVSKALKVDDPKRYYGLGALFVDVNGDGKPDLVVANDSTPNYLYINNGHGGFNEEAYERGLALNGDGHEVANMGIAAGDYRNDGHIDIAITTFSDDYDILFQNDGDGNFADVSYAAGIAMPTMPFVGFGDGFLDYDNDGWKDLFFVNGHVYPEVDQHPEWGTSYAERHLLFHNLKNGRFGLIPPVEGTGLAAISVGRGAAFGDIFNDGKIDVVINNMDGPPLLLRNINPDHHHWVELLLVGAAKSPKDAVGSTVYLTAAGLRQRADVLSGGSYLSSNDFRLHFGLGDSVNRGTAEIHWPDGVIEKIELPGVDRIYTITEGKSITGALCGASECSSEKIEMTNIQWK